MKPYHAHDCNQCQLLGQVEVKNVDRADDRFDLYFCEKMEGAISVIARYGQYGEYVSYPAFANNFLAQLENISKGGGPYIALAVELLKDVLKERERAAAIPRCETCRAEVREGLRFCRGLSDCWRKGVGL